MSLRDAIGVVAISSFKVSLVDKGQSMVWRLLRRLVSLARRPGRAMRARKTHFNRLSAALALLD